jgi:hypothetical protein
MARLPLNWHLSIRFGVDFNDAGTVSLETVCEGREKVKALKRLPNNAY